MADRLVKRTHARLQLVAFILNNSLLLLVGAAAAVLWANLDLATYDAVAHPLLFWVNDVGMVFFFALAAKEVFEATLPGGALASPRQALSPLLAGLGGMLAPAAIYLSLAATLGPVGLMRGWAIPCATDIAFSAMVARLIFPPAHPAVPFLLFLAIADDALGLLILAAFYPSQPISLVSLVPLMTTAIAVALWASTSQYPKFLALHPRRGFVVVGCVVPGRYSSGAGARPNRAVHAPQSSRPWALQRSEGTSA